MVLPAGPTTPALWRNMQFEADPFGFLDRLAHEFGDIFTITFGSTPIVFVSDPEGIRQIFTSTREITAPGELNQIGAALVGTNGLPLLDGNRHKQRRKLLMPALHSARLQSYGQRICELTEQVIQQQPIDKPLRLYPVLQRITGLVILDVLFGLHEEERSTQLKWLLPQFMNFARSPLFEMALAFPVLQRDWGAWSPWGKFLHLRQQFDQLIYQEIDDRRSHPDPSRTDLLSDLVAAQDESGQPLSNQAIRDLFPSLLFAGQDAASTAIAWTLYWIHDQPTVRERLLQELDGNSARPIDLVQLPYLSAVCSEALRLNPVQIVTFPRRVESPLELMGYELSPGTVLRGTIYLTHQRPDLYPNPRQFRPERFLEKQFAAHEFLPFGGGARRCPGEALALLELKLVVATILSRYQLALVDEQPERPKRRGVNYPPANGLKMVVQGRRQPQAVAIASSRSG